MRKILAASLAFLALAAARAAEPVTTASGLVYQEVVAGTGATPKPTDKVKVHYVGRFLDGRVFDSSVDRGQPMDLPLSRVIKCWTEAMQLMKVGGKAKLYCPSAIAYGERGAGGGFIPPNAPLNFEIELIAILP